MDLIKDSRTDRQCQPSEALPLDIVCPLRYTVIMRDDIHKGAPVGRYWKLLVKACAREADWERAAPVAAQKAIAQELEAQSGPPFFRRLHERLSASQMSLVPDLSPVIAEAAGGLPLSPVQSHSVTRLLTADHRELNGGSLAESAALFGMRVVTEANARNLDGYFAREAPQDRRELMRRVRVALATVPFAAWAKSAITGESPRVAAGRKPLTLDEPIG